MYWTGIDVVGFDGPLVSVGGEVGEGTAVEFDEGFLDNGFHFAVALFHVHHGGDGDATSEPLGCGLGGVAYGAHVASFAASDEECCYATEGVAVVGIEVGWCCATSFVAKEVVLCCELASVFAFFFPLSEFFAYHVGEELFGFDE